MPYAYGERSRNNRASVHQHLLNIFDEVLLKHDHSVTCGGRSPDEQQELYNATPQRSQAPGRTPEGRIAEYPHMMREGGCWAMDVWPYVDGRPIEVQDYDKIVSSVLAGDREKYLVKAIGQYCQFAFFAGIVFEVAGDYFANEAPEFRLVWGGNWDEDATILLDQGFDDFPHWQMVLNEKPE